MLALASAPLVDVLARASHGDWYFREEWGGTQYSAYAAGNGKVHVKILIFASGSSRNFWAFADENNIEQGSRCWTHIEGASETDYPNFLIYEADNRPHNRPFGDDCEGEGCNPNDRGWVRLKVLSSAIIVTNTYDGDPVHVSADGQWHEFYLKRMSTEDWLTYLEFDYIEPAEYANKVYWVGNSVCYRREGGEISDQARGEQTRNLTKITGGNPDPAPQLLNPFLYLLNENGVTGYGKIAIPYVSTQRPYKYWIKGTGDPIPCDERADNILVNSADSVRGFFITMETQRSQDSLQRQTQSSNTVNIPAYHKIHDFAIDGVKYQEKNLWFKDYRWKQLTWKIYRPDEEELIAGDMFEIQRAYKADYSDAETIGLVPMAYDSLTTDSITKKQTYTYLDTVPAAWWNPVENSYKIYYRIRRGSSAAWEWDTNPFASKLEYTPKREYSPLMFEADQSKTYYNLANDWETSHKVNISLRVFNRYQSPARSEEDPGYSYYYLDPKQRFMLRKIMTELEDTIEIEIPRANVQNAIDEVRLGDETKYTNGLIIIKYTDAASTPCVHYKYETYIDTTGVAVYRPDKPYPKIRPVVPAKEADKDVYYTEAANINSLTASQQEFSDYVLLTWEPTDGEVGTYKIETRPAGKDTAWTVLEENYTSSWYKDRTANPFVSPEWEYRLTMTYECNGNSKSASKTVVGSRNPYGKISGYVRYEDGSACPGITVTASRTSTGKTVQVVETDENGYYLLDSLIYGEGYAYSIQPTSMSAQFHYNNTSAASATVTIGLNNCIRENVNFANISSVRFSGRVLYKNSTVPARDVQFKLNGVTVKRGTLPYLTDASGNFEFRVPENTPFTIQAYKEGHTFEGDGWVRIINETTGEEDSLLSLTKPLDGVRIYDQTKIRLIGRLAGGHIQAEKPLGFGLSQNNLGDDLKMVFELEGDNISQLVHYTDDLTRDSVSVQLRHDVRTEKGTDSVGVTRTEYYKKRIIVYPDVTTGEYYVDLFPVKYKITQATAKGYATLYADGKTSETLDLTDAPLHQLTNSADGMETDYNAAYSITYHSPISISCQQMQFGMPVDYYGEKTISRQNIMNQKIEVPIVEKQADGSYSYLFGAPVFKSEKYQFIVTAHEDYYYNNEPASAQLDQVRLQGGTLKVYNGMHDAINTEIQTQELDTLGQALITIPVDYVSFTKTGESALRVLDLSVEYQGAFVESQALRAYVTGDKLRGQDFASTHGDVVLFDILRDPPGSGSSAYIEAGTTYTYDCNTEFEVEVGMGITLQYGAGANIYMGAFAGMGAGAWSGMPTETATSSSATLPITATWMRKHTGSYTFTTSERITTGSDPLSVGSSADVYIGATQDVLFGMMDAVQPLDSLTYVTLAARDANGTMRTIAEGKDSKGQKYYLVIGTELGATSTISSTFVYTQSYIENELLPLIEQQRDALLMTGDSATVAAIVAATGKPAYWSRVAPEDPNFGLGGYYEQIKPDDKMYDDEVASYNRQYVNWFVLLMKNEREKISAIRGTNRKEVGTWSVGGTTTVSHSETYNSTDSEYNFLTYPSLSFNIGDFGKKEKNLTTGKTAGMGKLLDTAIEQKASGGDKPLEVVGKTAAATWKFSFQPICNIDWNMSPETKGKSRTKSVGFTLQSDNFAYEHLNVSVYRAEVKRDTLDYNEETEGNRSFTTADDDHNYGSYVYFLNGGATRCPWEAPDSTRFYTPKVPLSAGTLKLENPKLDVDVHERSNVPIDQPAVFNIRMTNEGEMPYGSGNGGLRFILKLQEGCNPKGARIMIDGAPLLEEGREYRLTRGTVEFKRVEVYAGEGYDFENIVLTLMSECSLTELARCTFSAHFMPVACPVNISAPHNNWIMNTLSPQDSTGWYLPVVIDGFDVNYANFDHIEFQYKLATHSDDDWVNLCSYYADDSLYAAASGNKAMINGGRIENVRFYGERDPMEQQYDLRAVSFCRHGNAFITRASAVMRGMKDTRVPRVFGEAQPANSILGVGDNLLLRFNEPIAGNYLDEDNNFQLVGYTNETDITTGISLHFIDTEKSYAESKVVRSISDKSFTVDMMVRPQDPDAAYNFFEYKIKGGRLFTFGKTDDNRLFVKLGDGIIYSDTLPEKMIPFTRIAVAYDRENRLVRFYAGTQEVTDTTVAPFDSDKKYSGSAPICIGKGFAGNMMEVRLWTKALSPDEIAGTNMKRLTGYERELVAYYPMNEGKGETLTDKAHGATLYTHQTDWEYQKGISLHVTNGQAVQLDDKLLSRSNKQDETLMLWFKSPSKSGTIFSAGRESETQGTELALSKGALVLKSYKNEWKIDGNYSDNEWHHFAMTINRTFNIVAVYVDDQMKLSFASDKMGEVSGDMFIGGNKFEGNVDEFIIFEQALPKSLMETYGTLSPLGNEMGLMAYLPFQEMKENANGILEQVFSINDQRVFKTSEGDVVEKIQPLILSVSDSSDVHDLGDRALSAPVQDIGQLTKMNFDWTFNNDELLINLNMRDREINKQTIYITVRDVEDLNGNPMTSPVTWTTFVDKNALKWARREMIVQAVYDASKEPIEQTIRIINHSGKRHQFTIESIPDWLSLDETNGSIDPTDEITLTLSFNPELGPGVYSDVLYLTDGDGLSDPLRIEFTVEALPPYDDFDKGKYPLNMSICGQVKINDTFDSDENDIVYVTYRNECIGMANIDFDNIANTSKLFLTVYGDEDMVRKEMTFQLWQASTGKLINLEPDRQILFAHGYVYGCGDEQPVIFTTIGSETQNIDLKAGWTWISTNLQVATPMSSLQSAQPWSQGDQVKNAATLTFNTYSQANDQFVGDLKTWDYTQVYMVYSAKGNTLRLGGELIAEADKHISLRGDGQWNSFPCLFDQATSIDEALADYYDHASAGDLLKAHDRFSVFSSDKHWEGSLKTIYPGEGYLFRRMGAGTVTVNFYSQTPAAAPQQAPAFRGKAASNMTMICVLNREAINAAGNKRDEVTVHAYIGDELVGVASPITIDQSPMTNGAALYFLTITSEATGTLRFETESGQELMIDPSSLQGGVGGRLIYAPDSHHGSLKAPIVLKPCDDNRPYKIIENNHVIIIRNNEKYGIDGKKLQ